MSNDNDWERYAKLNATVGKLVLDGKRTPSEVADVLQEVVNWSSNFSLFADLGIIMVPKDYNHATQLTTFFEKNWASKNNKKFRTSINIMEAQFPTPSRVLKPGERLHVRAFKVNSDTTASSEECLAFLNRQKSVYTGAQGASLVYEQKRNQLQRDRWYLSFDVMDRLWLDADGNHRVPCIDTEWEDGGFGFNASLFKKDFDDNCVLLSFRDVK